MTQTHADQILTHLLGLFLRLNLADVTGHEYVDYLFEKYPRLESLAMLDAEIELEQEGILVRMMDKPDVKEAFRKRLIEIKQK